MLGRSILGRILLGFTSFFLNTFLPLFVGMAFNFIYVYQYKAYQRRRDIVFNKQSSNLSTARHSLTQKDCKESKTNKNMFFMALTLCSLSILFLFLNIWIVSHCGNFVLFYTNTLVSTVGFFVFYSFNKIFRQVFNQRISRK